ncbi:hypothetical protein AC249_AIPGENE3310, partial [Exaiptasia diaphana]
NCFVNCCLYSSQPSPTLSNKPQVVYPYDASSYSDDDAVDFTSFIDDDNEEEIDKGDDFDGRNKARESPSYCNVNLGLPDHLRHLIMDQPAVSYTLPQFQQKPVDRTRSSQEFG